MTAHQRPALRIRPIGVLAAAVVLASASWLGQMVIGRPDQASDPAGRPAVQEQATEAGPPGVAGPSIADAPASIDLSALDGQIATWSAKAAANDDDYISATNLGLLYLGRARLTGDLSDYDRAGQAVERALAADPGYLAARALDAVVRFAMHDFTGALASAEALLADEPDQVDALTVAADASLELGRLDVARSGYDRLATLAPGPALDVREARLAYLTGDVERSVELARGARDAALARDLPDVAFFHYQLGEFARLSGDAEAAREAFQAALDVQPADRAALLGLARVDTAAGRLDDAVAGLNAAAAIAPEPATLALLGDVLAMHNDMAGAEAQYATVRFTGQLGDLAGVVYDRQLLLFELDHGGTTEAVLARAHDALAIRADAAGHDLVAWAFHRLGREDEAWGAIERSRASGITDARILFHAGAIALARGDEPAGRTLIGDALALGPALDPGERSEAEALLRR